MYTCDCSTCRPANHGPRFTLTEGYKWSLNVVFAQLALQVGPNRMDEYARRFGFGTQYDLGVPVAASRIASDAEQLAGSKNLLAATGYGQGDVQATPLEMALVAATVARGGTLPTPYLVGSIREPQTNSTGMAIPAARYWACAVARRERCAEGDDGGVDQDGLGERRGHTGRDGGREDGHSRNGARHVALVVHRLGGGRPQQAAVRSSRDSGRGRRGHPRGRAGGT